MTTFNHGRFVDELRRRRRVIPRDLYDDLMAALDVGLHGPKPKPGSVDDPAWLSEARSHMGLKEQPGARHNPKIIGWVKALGGWFTDDETPWCGTFVAICMKLAGHPIPKHWYRARAWADWGQPTSPRVGAVVVFGRKGGGHVGFAVGESASYIYVLGGNQSNMVNIQPIAKSRMLACRWPEGVALSNKALPMMSGGAVSRNEA